MTLAERAATNFPSRSARKTPATSVSRREVFYDPTGRRWKLTLAGAFLCVVFLLLFAFISWEHIQQPPTLANGSRELPQPPTIPSTGLGQLAAIGTVGTCGPLPVTGLGQLPVIGTGPLVRVVRLEQSQGQL